MASGNKIFLGSRKGFTLIELLIVIAIIGVISGLVVSNLSGATDRARIAKLRVFSESVKGYLLMNRVSEWKFDEASGAFATDTVGTSNGTLTNAPVRKSGADCVDGGCLEFNGVTNSYVEIPDTDYLPAFSLSAWVYNVSGGDSRHSVLRDFWEVVGTQVCFWSYSFTNTYWRCSGSDAVPYDKWTHIVTTWDGSVIRHYADGKLIWKDPNLSSGTSQRFTTIAGYNGRIFKGRLDEIRIYSQAFTSSGIREEYLAGLNKLLAKGSISGEDHQQRLSKLNLAYAASK